MSLFNKISNFKKKLEITDECKAGHALNAFFSLPNKWGAQNFLI